MIYIGRAEDLQARLQQHLDGAVCECSRAATPLPACNAHGVRG